MNYKAFDFLSDDVVISGYTVSGNGRWHFDRTDDIDNYRELASVFGIDEKQIIRVNQKHTDKVYAVGEDYTFDASQDNFFQENCDGMVTNAKGKLLGIVTADCVPVLLYDKNKKVIAAVHSGREGVLRGIANNAVMKMQECYGSDPADIRCCLGPYICPECYELEDSFIDEFREYYSDEECGRIFTGTANGKTHLNLAEAIKIRLMRIGVRPENINIDAPCTCHNEGFYSWRRNQDRDSRILSFIIMSFGGHYE